MYLVRFIRKDMHDDVEYHYYEYIDAQAHYNLYSDYESELFLALQLIEISNDAEIVLIQKIFDFEENEIRFLHKLGTEDQFDTAMRLSYFASISHSEKQQASLIGTRIKIAKISREKFPLLISLIKEN